MMNKKALTPRSWIIMLVMISLCAFLIGSWIGNWSNVYEVNESTKNLSSYNKLSDISKKTEGMEKTLTEQKDITTLGFLDFVVKGGYNVVLSVLSFPSLLISIIKDIAIEYGIPNEVITAVVILVVVSVVFGIVSVVFRRKT